ncbi:Acetyl-coenzyme A synthetase [Streptomyces hirsutus]
MAEMDLAGVTTFCAPPTVWRMLIQSDLTGLRTPPREAVAAGEPLNPEVIEQIRRAWGVTVRDGFGQTETAVQIANSPGQPLRTGSMGRPGPGYRVRDLLDPVSGAPGATEGEIALDLSDRPVGLMTGYHGDPDRTAQAMAGGYYRTGDIGSRDLDGYLTYVGRADDVFKASDYKISPFELESALLEHEAVAEAAVVPAPDELRLAVPKAYIGSRRATGPARTPRGSSSSTPARYSPPTSGSAGWSSANCPRPSPARSAASNCARPRRRAPTPSTARRTSGDPVGPQGPPAGPVVQPRG